MALGVLFGSELLRLYTDRLWSLDVGHRDAFLRTTLIKAGLMVAATLVLFVLIYANLPLAQRMRPRPHLYPDDEDQLRVTHSRMG